MKKNNLQIIGALYIGANFKEDLALHAEKRKKKC